MSNKMMPVSRARVSTGAAKICSALLAVALLAAVAGRADAASMTEGVKNFKPYIVESIGKAIAGAKELQAAVKAGDVNAAQTAWIKSRRGWEVMETVTLSYFGDLDKVVDAWPDGKTGYHAIEVVLFKAEKVDGLDKPIADLLVNLDKFEKRATSKKFKITAQKLLEGTANLAYEVGEEKSTGGESPFAGTSIVDMQENVAGIEVAYRLVFADTLREKSPELAAIIEQRIVKLGKLVKVDNIKSMNQKAVYVAGEELAALLLTAAPKSGLKSFKVGDE